MPWLNEIRKWLEDVEKRLSDELWSLLKLSYFAEVPYGELQSLQHPADLYNNLIEKHGFTSDESLQLLLNRLSLLRREGKICVSLLSKHEIPMPESISGLRGKLSEMSDLMECIVSTLVELDSAKRKRCVERLGWTYLGIHPDKNTCTCINVFSGLCHNKAINVHDASLLFKALVMIGAPQTSFQPLQKYYDKHNLGPISGLEEDGIDSEHLRITITLSHSGGVVHYVNSEPFHRSFPSGQDNVQQTGFHHTDKKKRYACVTPYAVVICLAFLILCAIIVAVVISLVLDQDKSMKVFGRDNDTIYLDESDSLWYSEWFAEECFSPDTDYSHTTSLYRVQSGDIKFHHDDMYTSITGGHGVTPARDLGYYSNYLLEGSHINCTACLSTSSTTVENGCVFIFNDLNYYKDYLNGKNEGEETALYKQSLPIGTASKPVCTTIQFSVPSASYYYVATETPGGLGIMYQFNYTTHVVFLDHTDYNEDCYVKQPHKCTINIPNTFLKDEDYVLLGHIHPLAETTTTHICVTRNASSRVRMSITWSVVGLILLFSIVMSIFVMCKYYGWRCYYIFCKKYRTLQ